MARVAGERYVGEVAYPQETHAACVFLLDISDSMNYPSNKRPIDSLNEALRIFKQQASQDNVTKNVIDVAVVTFGGSKNKAEVVSGFTPVGKFNPPTLKADGLTPMGEGLELAIDLAKKQVKQYHSIGTDAHIPWIIMITDGYPTDSIEKAKALLEEERKKGRYGHLKLWIVAVNGAKLSVCQELTQRILFVKDKDYRSIFNWTADSMVVMSQSSVTEKVKLNNVPKNVQIVTEGMIPDSWTDF